MNLQEKIDQLASQINELARQQTGLSKQIIQLMDELEELKAESASPASPVPAEPMQPVEPIQPIQPFQPIQPLPPSTSSSISPKKKSTLEEFIGGNLTSKVGILITIIGIFIGAKYAIEHNLVNPVVRVIMGYVNGLVLIGISLRLRKKYEQYSAVLMGGGLAVLYFITYIAYGFYGMLPQLTAFGLMLVFTGGTVYASLLYNRIIIAHLGLVGAYAIPFLLSDNSGRVAVLFSYIAIINAGILVLAFRKNWKSLFRLAFMLTWLIFSGWAIFQYDEPQISLAFLFLSVFFLIFYATFLAYKLVKKELYNAWDVMLLLANAFIFFGHGYGLLEGHDNYNHLTGVFTLQNAAIHLIIGIVIRKMKLADKALLYLLFALVITFVTIAIPIQLDGNWVTLLWTVESVLVFIIGRTQQRASYERLSIVLGALAVLSMLHDWWPYLDPLVNWRDYPQPRIFNMIFFTGLLLSLSQGAVLYVHHRIKPENPRSFHLEILNIALPVAFLLTTYFIFELEIQTHFRQLYQQADKASTASEINSFLYVAVLLYTIIFTIILSYANARWVRNQVMAGISMAVIFGTLLFLLMIGLPYLNKLAMLYQGNEPTYFGGWNMLIRYLVMGAAAGLLFLGRKTLRQFFPDKIIARVYSVALHVITLTAISFEYLLWADQGESGNEYKLGLSILWAMYALALVVMGINKKKKHWRLTGICFFIITLVKLFAYDLSQATTISKTISFISLGAILLLVSYLYNRYKHVILAEDDENNRTEEH